MKNLYLLIFVFTLSTTLLAQRSNTSFPVTELKVNANYGVSYDQPVAGDAFSVPLQDITYSPVNHSGNLRATQTIIGATTYDLQTNASVARRMYNDGSLTAGIWTISLTSDLAAADRGTGYNADQGLGWGAIPTVRIETTRQGWPNLDKSSSGMEHVISHQFGTDVRLINRAVAGTGSWTETVIPAIPTVVHAWPRMAMGGANGTTIHLIDITMPTANGGAIVDGIDGLVTYSRSMNDGTTWDLQHITLPGVDSTLYPGFGADSYHIDADGDNIAIVSGRIDTDLAMWKSTDNGSTWTKTVIMQWPFPGYDDLNGITDVDGDGIADTVLTNDGKNCVLVDNNGMVHVWAGSMFVLDNVLADPLNLFLSTDGLMYWNESMGSNPPVIIAQSPDLDGDGSLTYAADYVPRYGNGGATTQPSAGIDPAGTIYVSYTTLIENTSSGNPSPGDFSYRNVFMTATADGGLTWVSPVNVSNSNFDEGVFASVARNVQSGSCVDLIWQQDGLPGIAVQAPDGNQALHPFGNNDIVHDCIVLVTGIDDQLSDASQIAVFPNPANGSVNVDLSNLNSDLVDIKLYNYSGQLIKYIAVSSILNNATVQIDLEDLNAGMYFLLIQSDEGTHTEKVMVY